MPLRRRWQVTARPGQSGPQSRQPRRSAKHGNRLSSTRQPLQVCRHDRLPWKTGWKLPKTWRARRRQAGSRPSLCSRRKLRNVTGR